ncbi:homoserine kinase [Sphaerisporangium sp. TRM90804]|uniref:homoserine kinase n=1 Tax=Sphaerisporangium sp. TRM90804 TaxID=3031113 RepID=UPI002447E71E|nr:homoserine kinase [Sphaerisporangium sp. TRM90804]MDH2428108.1 homoserine kinase [Sphaerisporangium sp. TRM90804]
MSSSSTVVVRVPATSANLGPGFDSLGLALCLYDEVEASVFEPAGAPAVEVGVEGEGAGELDTGEGHLIIRAMRATFERAGVPQPTGLRLRCLNRIPHARGLGSSSAAICAGILAARALAAPGLSDDEVFALATEMEGHPDNVAPCLFGGLTIAWSDLSGNPSKLKLSPHGGVRPVVCVPRTRLSTEEARGLLPKDVPHADAAANAGRAALLIAALTQRPEMGLLLAATEDRLHQAYRAPAMPRTAELVQRLREAGVPAVVSGAGPTVLALGAADTHDLIASKAGSDWHIQPLDVDQSGARVIFPRHADASSTLKE